MKRTCIFVNRKAAGRLIVSLLFHMTMSVNDSIHLHIYASEVTHVNIDRQPLLCLVLLQAFLERRISVTSPFICAYTHHNKTYMN